MRWDLPKRLWGDRRGTVAVLLALMLPVVLGMLTLGVETGLWFATRRSLQGAADAAALSGAFEVQAGLNDAAAAAALDASRNGFTAGSGATITVNNPPLSGAYAGDARAVEVILSQPQSLLLSQLFLNALTIQARAVALGADGQGQYCVLGLDTSEADTIYLSNNARLPNASCGAASNSTNASGLNLKNNASISGAIAVAATSYHLSNNAEIEGAAKTGVVTDDPYADVTRENLPACTGQTSQGWNNVTINLTPGNFCSGMDFKNNATVNFAPGTYYVQSKLTFQNNAIMNATGGVTIVVVGNYAIDIGNNAIINITAPSSGNYAGLAFFGDRSGTSTVKQVFSNNTTLNITGAIYFPNQIAELDNNASTSANGCSQLIARKVIFSNNANLPSNCTGSGTKGIGASANVSLVE